MSNPSHVSRAKVWLYPGMAGWHFITLSKALVSKLEKGYKKPKRGWGSIPVVITIGTSTWKTSMFPDKKSGSYVIPIKAQVRKKESIEAGDTISFSLKVDAHR